MVEAQLLICLLCLAILALVLAVYPLKHSLRSGLMVLAFLCGIAVLMAYQQWGAFPAWQAYMRKENQQQQAKALLATIKSPQELIDKLLSKLDDSPKSAHGWYLLGRLYSNQAQWDLARDAFKKAHDLNANDELSTINYANSLWQLNQQVFDSQITALFKDLLQKNPNQPDALAMLAMDAWQRQDYRQAEVYWQRLLKLAPPQSKEAKALRKAIAAAHQK